MGEVRMPVPPCDPQREFLDLVEAHQGILHKVSALYAEQLDEREDLRQEILMQLWRSFSSFRGDSRFSTWMYRVALNTALLARRKRRTRPVAVPLAESSPPQVGAAPGSDPDVERLQRCVRRLRELDRAVILLYLEQHTHEEIAEVTGLGRKTVGVRIVRIKKQLKQWLTASPGVARARG
jgi:RNA polymerase sigma-70 factor (ECF subfamily)